MIVVDATLFGVLNDARARQRQRCRRRRIWITAAVAIAGRDGRSPCTAGRPRNAGGSPGAIEDCATVRRRMRLADHDHRDAKPIAIGDSPGTPTPATATDALPPRLTSDPLGGSQIFINYVRRARVITGGTYFIYPLRATTCGRLDTRGDAIALTNVTHCGIKGFSETFGGATASQIEAGKMLAYGGGCSRSLDTSLLTGVVPDGVATVTLHYRAGTRRRLQPQAGTGSHDHNHRREQRHRRHDPAGPRQRSLLDHDNLARHQRPDHQDVHPLVGVDGPPERVARAWITK